ncbi:hypothetical protein FACS189427_07550 [Planctomycetales bacterium]|nr:hypothetical protein FACS189427_07550 [Planctomycetales bacterium]
MKKIIPFLCFCVVSVFCLAVSAQDEKNTKYTLKVQYPAGKYQNVIDSDMDMTIGMSGQTAKMPMKQKQTQYMTLDVTPKTEDGTQTLTMETTRIATEVKSPFANMKFDSADPDAANGPMKAAGVAVGLKAVMTCKDGKIIKVEGIEEFFEKLAANPDYPKQTAEMLKKQFNNESLTKNFDIQQKAMPSSQPVAVGEQWKTDGTAEIPMLGKVKTVLNNTLKEVKEENGKKIAVIISKTNIKSAEPKELEAGNGVKTTFTKFSIDTTTTFNLEIESGLVLSSDADIVLEMESKIEAAGKTIEQQLSGTGKSTVTIAPFPVK